jgi:two-component system sensor histidine kinase QseC
MLARDRRDLDASLARISGALAGAGLLLLLAAALVVTASLRRGLQPLAALADRASRIDAGSLGSRFPEAGLPDELRGISRRLNDLLGRLGASFQRERRFSADVAHELRTPIAELRALAEVALRAPQGHEPEAGSYRDVLDVAVQMERVVGNLLALARCDAGRQDVKLETLDLGAVARDAWRPFQAGASARGLTVSFDLPPAVVDGDRALLGAIFTNLYSNAVDHAPAGGALDCALHLSPGGAELAVENTCAGVTGEDLPHLFEPFWRKDAARSDREHSGLGLALVAAYAKLIGAKVEATLPSPDRFRIVLRVARPPAAAVF